MRDNLFAMVEKEFRDYSYRLHQIENLEHRRKNLSVVRSSSDFAERVDTGNRVSSPIEMWIEQQEFFDEQIAGHRLHVEPITQLLSYFQEFKPEMVKFFELRYKQRVGWPMVEEGLAISTPTRNRMRKELILTGARFLGMLNDF